MMDKFRIVLINSNSTQEISIYSSLVSAKLNDSHCYDASPGCSLMCPDLPIAKIIKPHSLSGSLLCIPAGKSSTGPAGCAGSTSSV